MHKIHHRSKVVLQSRLIFVSGVLVISAMLLGMALSRFWPERPLMKPSAAPSPNRNFELVGLALANYRLLHRSIPNDSFDPFGKPLLSWRVHLLPLLGYEDLFREFKLDEPWDSPTNRALLDRMPNVFRGTNLKDRPLRQTYLQMFKGVGPSASLPTSEMNSLPLTTKHAASSRSEPSCVPDGEEYTIFAIETDVPVEWTKPDELQLGLGSPVPGLGGDRGDRYFFAITLDGTVRRMNKAITPYQLRAMLTIDGGELIELEEIDGLMEVIFRNR